MDLTHVVSQTAFVEPLELDEPVGIADVGSLSLDELLDKRFFAHAAERARETILRSQEPYKWTEIFELWYVRLSCLQRARLEGAAAEESRNLGESGARRYRDEDGACCVPWKLRLLLVSLQSGGAGAVALSKYYVLAREARTEAARAAGAQTAEDVWRARLRQLGLAVAATLIDMRESPTAIDHLRSLRRAVLTSGEKNAEFVRKIDTILVAAYLRIGDTCAAAELLQELDEPALRALCLLVDGDVTGAETVFRDLQAQNNLAVTYVQTGRVDKAIELLEQLARDPQQSTNTVVRNLLALTELRGS